MSFLAKLESGIRQKDWSVIISVYEALSGQVYTEDSIEDNPKKVVKKKAPKKTKPIKKTKKKTPTLKKTAPVVPTDIHIIEDKAKVDKKAGFIDDGTLCVEDREFDRLIKRSTSERRPPVQFLDIKCSKCGKEDKLCETEVQSRKVNGEVSNYICQKCLVGRGK